MGLDYCKDVHMQVDTLIHIYTYIIQHIWSVMNFFSMFDVAAVHTVQSKSISSSTS